MPAIQFLRITLEAMDKKKESASEIGNGVSYWIAHRRYALSKTSSKASSKKFLTARVKYKSVSFVWWQIYDGAQAKKMRWCERTREKSDWKETSGKTESYGWNVTRHETMIRQSVRENRVTIDSKTDFILQFIRCIYSLMDVSMCRCEFV